MKIQKFSDDFLKELSSHGIPEDVIKQLKRMRGIELLDFNFDCKEDIVQNFTFDYDEYLTEEE